MRQHTMADPTPQSKWSHIHHHDGDRRSNLYSNIIVALHPHLNGAFAGIDGLNLPVQTSDEVDIENATYNGWKSDIKAHIQASGANRFRKIGQMSKWLLFGSMRVDCLQFSRRTFYRILDLWHTTGDVVRWTYGIHGRSRLLRYRNIDYLRRLLRHRPHWFLDKLVFLWKTNPFISAHYLTVHWDLVVHAGVSSKKLKKVAAERIRHLAPYSPEQLGF